MRQVLARLRQGFKDGTLPAGRELLKLWLWMAFWFYLLIGALFTAMWLLSLTMG